MSIAEIHGKLSSTASNIHDRMEDLLTSDVFGTFKYLGLPYIRDFLASEHVSRFSAGQPAGKIALDGATAVQYEFWPRIKRREPDLLLRFLSDTGPLCTVTDTSCGKLYVGSACGSGGIWGRWSAYVQSLHGGNRELKVLLQKKGKEHASFLQFSILEICDIKATQDQVRRREAHWKDVLCSREFGYNAN